MTLSDFLDTYVASGTYIAIVDGINESYFEGRAGELKRNRYLGDYNTILTSRVIEVYAEKPFPGVLMIYIDIEDDNEVYDEADFARAYESAYYMEHPSEHPDRDWDFRRPVN